MTRVRRRMPPGRGVTRQATGAGPSPGPRGGVVGVGSVRAVNRPHPGATA